MTLNRNATLWIILNAIALFSCAQSTTITHTTTTRHPNAYNLTDNSLFNISEYNWKGASIPLDAHRKFVDLNSTIMIDINSDAVANRINKKAGATPETDALVQEISKLTPILRKSNEVMDQMATDIKKLDPSSPNYLKDFTKVYYNSALLFNQLWPVINHPGDKLYIILNDTLRKAFMASKPADQIFNIIFSSVGTYVNTLNNNLSTAISNEGIKIQLAATLNSAKGAQTELPLPGYDNASTPAFYDPYAFSLSLDSAQLQQLKQYKSASDSFNAHGFKNFFTSTANSLKTKLPKEALSALDSILPLFTDKQIAALIQDTSGSTKNLRSDLSTLITTVKMTEGTVKSLVAMVSKPDNQPGPQVQSQLIADIAGVTNDITGLISTCTSIKQNINNLTATPVGIDKAALVNLFDSIKAKLLSMNLGTLGSALQTFSDMGNSVNSIAVFGNTIISHTLSDMPSQTEVDLKKAGYRQHGDEVRIEMRVITKNGKAVTLGYQRVLLFKEQGSFELQATLGFINQYTKGTGFENLFHVAPSTTILFKFPTPNCTNIAYRKFIDFGMGLNIATFNFNPNTFTEVGLGLAFSCFNVNDNWRNVLQGGIGYNLVGNKMYIMVGINIPFLGFSSDLK